MWCVATNAIASQTAVATHPPAIRTMLTFAFTAPFSGSDLDNVITIGGEGLNGVKSAVQVDSYVGVAGANVGFSDDTGAFPALPTPLSGGIIASDSTAALKSDANGYANASIFIFGGENNTEITQTMYRTFTPSGQTVPTAWIVEDPLGPHVPEARMDSAGVEISGFWYVFGGRDANGTFGDTWVYEFATKNWTKLHDFGYVAHANASQAWATSSSSNPLPRSPPARYGHAMTKMTGTNNLGALTDLIILAGGHNGEVYFDDMWAFDPSSKNWEQLSLPATHYSPRAHCGLFAHHNESYVFLYGGDNNGTAYADLWTVDLTVPPGKAPSFKALPNNIIAGVAGGILLVLIITVVVLKVTDRNSS